MQRALGSDPWVTASPPLPLRGTCRYHSRNKPLEGGVGAGSEGMLVRVAEATQGFSAAGLANLMNESAILTVRRGVERISLPMVLELIEGINWGVAADKLPPSEAKNRCGAGAGAACRAYCAWRRCLVSTRPPAPGPLGRVLAPHGTLEERAGAAAPQQSSMWQSRA